MLPRIEAPYQYPCRICGKISRQHCACAHHPPPTASNARCVLPTYYCSVECQMKDADKHIDECRPHWARFLLSRWADVLEELWTTYLRRFSQAPYGLYWYTEEKEREYCNILKAAREPGGDSRNQHEFLPWIPEEHQKTILNWNHCCCVQAIMCGIVKKVLEESRLQEFFDTAKECEYLVRPTWIIAFTTAACEEEEPRRGPRAHMVLRIRMKNGEEWVLDLTAPQFRFQILSHASKFDARVLMPTQTPQYPLDRHRSYIEARFEVQKQWIARMRRGIENIISAQTVDAAALEDMRRDLVRAIADCTQSEHVLDTAQILERNFEGEFRDGETIRNVEVLGQADFEEWKKGFVAELQRVLANVEEA